MTELEKMLIERECHKLMVSYNLKNDGLDVEGFVSLFTEDCVFAKVVPEPRYEVRGHDGLRASMKQIILDSPCLRRHLLVNPQITVLNADEAEGFCIGLAIFGPAGDRSLPVPVGGIELVGEYHDRYRRTENGWKIASRELTRVIDMEA